MKLFKSITRRSDGGSINAFGLEALAILIVVHWAYFALVYANQPLLDRHAFRQTQTALSAYWLLKEGFKLAYETPVAGIPWSIPFEFPLYQYLVVAVVKIFHIPLEVAGRVLSSFFLLLCFFPVFAITKQLNLTRDVSVRFVILAFSMPIYMYWGRSFTIETLALFLTLCAVYLWLLLQNEKFHVKTAVTFIIVATLALLQKATTALPLFVLLGCISLFRYLKYNFSQEKKSFTEFSVIVIFATPLIVLYLWICFSDHIKSLNPMGGVLTSSALTNWNWGGDRFAASLWKEVFWLRIIKSNLGGYVGILAFLVALTVVRKNRSLSIVIIFSLLAGIVPVVFFPNLHHVHDYYQVANAIFFAYAMAICLTVIASLRWGRIISLALLCGVLLANWVSFDMGYKIDIDNSFSKRYRAIAIGEILKRELEDDQQFVAFGNDWNPTFAYFSQRKSFTVPTWFPAYDKVVLDPGAYVENEKLGGLVACGNVRPDAATVVDWATNRREWKVGASHGCLIATPEHIVNAPKMEPLECKGKIKQTPMNLDGTRDLVNVSGWATSEINGGLSSIYLLIKSEESSGLFLETLRIPNSELITEYQAINSPDQGFSRLIHQSVMKKDAFVRIVLRSDNRYWECISGVEFDR